MAENGNGNGVSEEPILQALITKEEMKIAFEMADRLGVTKEFGGSSPLGGIVVLLLGLIVRLTTLEMAFERLQQTVGAMQKKIGFTLNDL